MAIKRTREQWVGMIADMEASGLTQKQWCMANNINYSTMKEMRARVKKGTPSPDTGGTRQHKGVIDAAAAAPSWVVLPHTSKARAAEIVRIEAGPFIITIESAL